MLSAVCDLVGCLKTAALRDRFHANARSEFEPQSLRGFIRGAGACLCHP